MKKTRLFITLLVMVVISRVNAQSLYTETGSNSTPGQVKPNKCNQSKYSYSTINVNNALVEGGLYSSYGIEPNMKLHTQCDSQIDPKDFADNKRWYQEDGKTQIFRLFKGEDEPSGYSRARTEAHSKTIWGTGAWHEWVGRFTLISPLECSLLQVKSNGKEGYEWPLQIEHKDGRIFAQFRIPVYTNGQLSGGKTVKEVTLGNFKKNDSFDVKVRDNGETVIIYINGIEKASYTHKRPAGTQQRFRWGMYRGKHDAEHDAILFVSHAQVDGKDIIVTPPTNKKPTVSFNVPNKDITLLQGYSSLTVVADASDLDGTIEKVELKVDGKLIREEKGAPYEWGHESQNPETLVELLGLSVGEHTLTLIAYDDKGASTAVERKVTVDKVTGASDELSFELAVYPNPSASGIFHLAKEEKFSVLSITGEVLFEGDGVEIDLSDYPAGTYMLKTQGIHTRIIK